MDLIRISGCLTLGVVAAMAWLTLPAAPALAEQGCHPAYTGACVPAGTGDVDCSDLATSVTLADAADDPYHLDADGNGTGCERNHAGAAAGAGDGAAGAGDGAGDDRDTMTGDDAWQDTLPTTGVGAPAAAGVGTALLVGGAALMLVARRREGRHAA